MRGKLAAHELPRGERQAGYAVPLNEPDVLTAGDVITHHEHNRGDKIAVSAHTFAV